MYTMLHNIHVQCCTPILCAMMHNSCQCVQCCTNGNNACAMAYKSTQVAHYLYGIPSKDIMYNIAHHMYSAVQLTPTCTMLSQSRVHNVAHLRTTCTLHSSQQRLYNIVQLTLMCTRYGASHNRIRTTLPD